MRKLFSALAVLAAACSIGAGRAEAAVATSGPDPWAGEWAGATRTASGRLTDTLVRVEAGGAAELRTPGCAEALTFVRWGVPGRVYRGSGQCGPAEAIRLVIGADGVMRVRSVMRGPNSAFYGALRVRANVAPMTVAAGAPAAPVAAAPVPAPMPAPLVVAAPAAAAAPIAAPAPTLGLLSLPPAASAATAPAAQTGVAPPSGPLGESDLLGAPGSLRGSLSKAAPGALQP